MFSLVLIFLLIAQVWSQDELVCDNCRALVEFADVQSDNQGVSADVSFIRPAPFSIRATVNTEGVDDGTYTIAHFYTSITTNVTALFVITNKDWTSTNGVGEITIMYPAPKQVSDDFDGEIEFKVDTRFLPANTTFWSLHVEDAPRPIVIDDLQVQLS
jgi:hypothetical protein